MDELGERQGPAARSAAVSPNPGTRWLARFSILLMAGSVAVLIIGANGHGIGLVISGIAGACVLLAAAYWFLARRGLARWTAGALAVAAPAGLLVFLLEPSRAVGRHRGDRAHAARHRRCQGVDGLGRRIGSRQAAKGR